MESFKKIVATGRVEVLSETYYHSLAWLYSKEEFAQQIKDHRKLIYKIFRKKPTIFRNTELIPHLLKKNFCRFVSCLKITIYARFEFDFFLHNLNLNVIFEKH